MCLCFCILFKCYKTLVKKAVKRVNRKECWLSNQISRITQYKSDFENCHDYWDMPKFEAKALLCWKVGCLKFKDHWRLYNSTKYGNTNWLFKECKGKDDYNHVKNCKFYDTRFTEDDDERFAKFLVSIHHERIIKFKMPLI